MLDELAYGASAVLIGLSFAAIFGMFAASGVLLWRMGGEALRRRRQAAEQFRRIDSELSLRRS